jgi:hypothetical protein
MLGAGATSGLAIRPCAVGAHSSRAGGFGSRVWILDSRWLGDGGSRRLRNRGSLAWSRGGCDYNCGGGRCRRRRRQTRIWTVRGRSVSAGAQHQKGGYQGQKCLLNHVAHRLNRVRASGTLVDNSASCSSPQATYILFRRRGCRSCPQIAKAHRGIVRAEPGVAGGLEVVVALPSTIRGWAARVRKEGID